MLDLYMNDIPATRRVDYSILIQAIESSFVNEPYSEHKHARRAIDYIVCIILCSQRIRAAHTEIIVCRFGDV